MKKLSPEMSLSLRLGAGFALILLLMLALGAIGLGRLTEVNQRMQQIVNENNVKVEQAHIMKDALRERSVIMHTISLLSDPFEQNEEFLDFNDHGTAFTTARTRLEGMSLDPKEKEILARMRALTVKTQPLVVQAVDQALGGNIEEARNLIRKEIVGSQKLIGLEINDLLALQKADTENVVAEATQAYSNTRLLMLLLGAAATGLGLAIAFVVIRNARQQAHLLRHQAMHDNLTGLPNRALFDDRLQQAILIGRREKQPFALIAMDLDRFKEINDTLGHYAGDRVLQHMADCVRACLRESDTVARMGGDEFTVLLTAVNDLDGAVAAAEKILKAFDEPLEISGQKIEIAASLGIAMFPSTATTRWYCCARPMPRCIWPNRYTGGYKVYSKELGQGADDRVALQGELRRAIAANELVLHYQPKIDFGSDRVSGVEALVRWQHPKHGLLPPDKFIPLAEQTGLIKPMTQHILKMALHQCEEWQRAGLDLSVAVNISAISIQDPEFPDQVARLLKESTVPPSRIELEITETAVMAEPVRAVDCIKRLSALGLQVSIDDFGTGYSSMAHLKELLVAKIKIDKSFVKDVAVNHNDAVIVRSTIELGHNLGLKVVAEGVETEAAWDRLKALGCDDAQGYYMSHPLPADKLAEWLRQSPWGLKRQGK